MTDERTPSSSRAEQSGDRIDRYELVSELGAGGMGSVWRATQHEPVRREVALKIIKLGMDTEEVIRRFDLERQALALMDHPHVAKVFDGGATETGRPYFVMELVDGEPITDYCDKAGLGIRARIDLLRQSCLAVQHAHQKGIIHRDLKPSNVLVTEQDGVAVPKIIDFGIAKATDVEAAQHTMLTQHAQILGTPEYMAPEQADSSGDQDVDTRADVYSLGVLLYEVLTGTKPFSAKEALAIGFQELLRQIREVDPERPSTRVSTHGGVGKETTITLATGEPADSTTLSRRLRGDLDWIVMRALEKDRDRRYGSASDFAEDLRRFLDGEPVEAAPPSSGYRLRKFVKRRKKAVAAAALIGFLFVAGAVGSGLGWRNAVVANSALEVALDDKSRALDEAKTARATAEQSERTARQETEFARAARAKAERRFEDLKTVANFQKARLDDLDPGRMGEVIREGLRDALPRAGVTATDALTPALDRIDFTTVARRSLQETLFAPTLAAIESDFGNQPVLQAQLLQVQADTLMNRGFALDALDPQERALALRRAHLELDHPDLLESMSSMSRLLAILRRYDEAEPLQRELIQAATQLHGPEHRNTLTARNNLGDVLQAQGDFAGAEQIFAEVLKTRRRVLSDVPGDIAQSEHNLAFVRQRLGKLPEAKEGYDRAVEAMRRLFGEADQRTVIATANRGMLHSQLGEREEAKRDLDTALAGMRRLFGDLHPMTQRVRESLQSLEEPSASGQGVAAEDTAGESTSTDEPADEMELAELEEAARSSAASGGRREAESLFRRALDRSTDERGADDPATIALREELAVVLQQRGKIGAAGKMMREALEARRRSDGPDDPATLLATKSLGEFFESHERFSEAESLYAEAYEGMQRVLGPDHADTLTTRGSLGGLIAKRGAHDEAVPHLRAAVEGKRRTMGEQHPEVYATMETLAFSLEATAQWEELETIARETHDFGSRVHGNVHPVTITSGQRLGTALARQGRLAEAEGYLRTAAEDATSYLGKRNEYPMILLNALANVLIGQGKLEEAEACCRTQLERRRAMTPAGHPYVVGCAANLGDVLLDRGSFAEAEPLLAEAAAGAPRAFGQKSEWTLAIVGSLARARRGLDQPEEADAKLQRLVDAARAESPVDANWLADVLLEFGAHMLEAERIDDAIAMFDEGLRLRDVEGAEPCWQIMALRNAAGAARGLSGDFANAESLVLDSAEWLWNDPSMPPATQLDGPEDRAKIAAERAVAFLEAWHADDPNAGHAERAATWRARLEERARAANH
ncbi:MAG: serine/threonine-protein kinase [Planctomycetota bacterium]